MNVVGPGAQFRRAMIQDIRDFEKTMPATSELRISVFMPTREVYFLLGQVGSSDLGFINLFGETEAGELVNLSMHYTHVIYQLHAVASGDQPRRIGFHLK